MDLYISENPALVRVTPKGKLTLEYAGDLVKRMLDHPNFKPGLPSIWDLRETDVSAFSLDNIQSLIAINRKYQKERGNAYIAIVAPDDLSFGLSRMYEMLDNAPHLRINVFRDLALAEKWIKNYLK